MVGRKMIDRSHVWTGSLNERALGPLTGAHIGLYDTTLRDGEQTVGVVLAPEQKLEIAFGLADAGVDRIEAGFPRVSQEDWRAVELMSAAGLDAELWGFSRAVQADVEALVELGLSASVIESPISDLKLTAIGVTRESMLERITKAVSFAVEAGITVAFFGVDGSRAEPDFFRAAYRAAREAGAAEIVVVDTLGIASPEAAAQLVTQARDAVGDDVPVHWHGHDDFGLATAAAVAAVRAGASWVHGTINGMGERGGNADLAEAALSTATRPTCASTACGRCRPRCEHGQATSSSRGSRWSARTSSRARVARLPRSSTILRRSSPIPRRSLAPTVDSCSARRAVSTRSASEPMSSGSA